jgi:hypothetical protein
MHEAFDEVLEHPMLVAEVKIHASPFFRAA